MRRWSGDRGRQPQSGIALPSHALPRSRRHSTRVGPRRCQSNSASRNRRRKIPSGPAETHPPFGSVFSQHVGEHSVLSPSGRSRHSAHRRRIARRTSRRPLFRCRPDGGRFGHARFAAANADLASSRRPGLRCCSARRHRLHRQGDRRTSDQGGLFRWRDGARYAWPARSISIAVR